MGMDLLDLTFRLEKRFGIDLESVELFYFIDRVSRVEDLVWDHLQGIRPALPVEPRLFAERIIREILSLPGTRKDRWGPGRLDRMIPGDGRAENWKRLGELLELPLPELRSPTTGTGLNFPKELETVGGLVNWTYKNHRDRLPLSRDRIIGTAPKGAEQFDREAVRRIVREIICDCLGVAPSQVTPDARLIEDLGMG